MPFTEPAYLVGTGGAIGAVGRYLISMLVSYLQESSPFPTATLVVNTLGSFLFGLVIFSGVGGDIVLFVGVGICGAFTTYSSFSVQTVRLYETGNRGLAALNAVGNLVVCGVAVGLAWLLVG